MANRVFRRIRSPAREKALLGLENIRARKEVNEALDKTKKALVVSHEKIVADWKSDVRFRAAKFIRPGRIWVTVFPVGKDRLIWFYVDQGTKPHSITVKSSPFLIFKAGEYIPKTKAKPARTVSGGGRVKDGHIVKVKKVKHPGSEARNFTATIAEDIEPSFKREVENAFRRTANAGG